MIIRLYNKNRSRAVREINLPRQSIIENECVNERMLDSTRPFDMDIANNIGLEVLAKGISFITE